MQDKRRTWERKEGSIGVRKIHMFLPPWTWVRFPIAPPIILIFRIEGLQTIWLLGRLELKKMGSLIDWLTFIIFAQYLKPKLRKGLWVIMGIGKIYKIISVFLNTPCNLSQQKFFLVVLQIFILFNGSLSCSSLKFI